MQCKKIHKITEHKNLSCEYLHVVYGWQGTQSITTHNQCLQGQGHFHASKGRFENFSKQISLYNVKRIVQYSFVIFEHTVHFIKCMYSNTPINTWIPHRKKSLATCITTHALNLSSSFDQKVFPARASLGGLKIQQSKKGQENMGDEGHNWNECP